jgi:hypothetical protein
LLKFKQLFPFCNIPGDIFVVVVVADFQLFIGVPIDSLSMVQAVALFQVS